MVGFPASIRLSISSPPRLLRYFQPTFQDLSAAMHSQVRILSGQPALKPCFYSFFSLPRPAPEGPEIRASVAAVETTRGVRDAARPRSAVNSWRLSHPTLSAVRVFRAPCERPRQTSIESRRDATRSGARRSPGQGGRRGPLPRRRTRMDEVMKLMVEQLKDAYSAEKQALRCMQRTGEEGDRPGARRHLQCTSSRPNADRAGGAGAGEAGRPPRAQGLRGDARPGRGRRSTRSRSTTRARSWTW